LTKSRQYYRERVFFIISALSSIPIWEGGKEGGKTIWKQISVLIIDWKWMEAGIDAFY
jgi:hypothetical protein